MAENIVKVDISFQSLVEAISSLGIAEKHRLWELLEAELFPDDDSIEDIAEIQAAHADYRAGDYMTFDEYPYSPADWGPILMCRQNRQHG